MRKLSLKKETLVELSSDELVSIVGGGPDITKPQCVSGIVSCVTYRCPTREACTTVIAC